MTAKNLVGGKRVRRPLLVLGISLLYGLLNWAFSDLTLPGATAASLRPQVAVPIVMGLIFGPVTGFIVGCTGNVFGDMLSGKGLQYWDWSIGNGLLGVIPGLVHLMGIRAISTVGQFGLVLLAILVANLVGLSTGTFIGSLVLHRSPLNEAVLNWLLPPLLTNVLLAFIIVPLLLLAVRRLLLTLETRVILVVTFLLAACILGITAILVYKANATLVSVTETAVAAQIVTQATLELLRWAGLASIITLLAGITVSVFVVKRLTTPVSLLCTAARTVGSGDFNTGMLQPVARRNDELGELARTFQNMVESLKIHMRELQITTAAKERIESELRVATDIQMSMLPHVFPPFPDRKEFDIFAMMQPAKEVGGDLYDFFFVQPNKLCFIIGDVCGKGVPAALFMAITKTLLKTAGMAGLPPNQMLSHTNTILNAVNESSMFATVFCAIMDTDTGEVTFANGGHPPALLCDSAKGFQYLKVQEGFVVGPLPDIAFTCESLTLITGDVIFLYTDGVTEAADSDNRLYSETRLQQTLTGLKNEDAMGMVKAVWDDIETFVRSAPQVDDITMLAVRFLGKTGYRQLQREMR